MTLKNSINPHIMAIMGFCESLSRNSVLIRFANILFVRNHMLHYNRKANYVK